MNEDLLRPEFYLDYSGKTGEFTYYDKELQTKVKIDLTEMVILNLGFSLKGGWDDSTNSAYYSNEVNNLTTEELILKSYKGGEKLKGYYTDIKDKLPEQVKLNKSITVLMDGKVIRFYLKTISMFEFGELLKTMKIEEDKLEFDKIDERKKGAIQYFVPVFKVGGKLSAKEKEAREETIKLMNKPVDKGPEGDLPFN